MMLFDLNNNKKKERIIPEFKISDNTLDFILERIDNSDFLEEKTILELKRLLQKYDFRRLENILIKNFIIAKNCVGYCKNFNVILNKPLLESSFIDLCVVDNNIYNNLTQKNIYILSSLFHELGHIHQRECNLNGKYTEDEYYTIIDYLYYIGEKVRMGNINKYHLYPKLIKGVLGNKIYADHHNIFPDELHADGFSINILDEIISYTYNREEYKYFEVLLLKELLSKYKFGNNVINPMNSFCSMFGLTGLYNDLATHVNVLSERERVLYGLSSDENEINKQISMMLNHNHIVKYSELAKTKKLKVRSMM